jgi:hypothetical protein
MLGTGDFIEDRKNDTIEGETKMLNDEDLRRHASRIESATDDAKRAADRMETAAQRIAHLLEDGYGGNGIRLLEALERVGEPVPEGYCLVPNEPTEAMVEAACKLASPEAVHFAPALTSALSKIYKAMLAARPA